MEIVFDLEASGLEYWAQFWCLSHHTKDKITTTTNEKRAHTQVVDWLQDEDTTLVGHNIITYDLPFILYGRPFPKIKAKIYDTRLISQALLPFNLHHSLGSWSTKLSRRGLCPPKVEVDDRQWGVGDVALMAKRCEDDVRISLALWNQMKQRDLRWYDLELAWIPHIIESLTRGIPISIGHMMKAEAPLAHEAQKIQDKYTYKISSPHQLGEAMKAKGVTLPTTPKGRISLNKDNRDTLSHLYPPIHDHFLHKDHSTILAYIRTQGKQTGNNIYKSLKYTPLTQPHLHPSFSYYGTRTLRSQYSKPCINQFPKGPVRECVRPLDPGSKLLGMDIEQLELSILGHELKTKMNDPTVWDQRNLSAKALTLRAFKGLFDNIEEQNKNDIAKRIHYATLYGQKAPSTCRELKLEPSSQNQLRVAKAVDLRYPKLSNYIQYLKARVQNNMMLNIYNQPVMCVKKGFEEREVVLNTRMQSSGAAYAKRLFSFVMNEIKKLDESIYLILFNHDEIQCLIPSWVTQEDIQQCLDEAYLAFENSNYKNIPLITTIDFKIGASWNETH